MFNGLPVDIGEKGLDVGDAFDGFVIQNEGMLPHIHDQPHRNEAGHIAGFVQRNPMIGESAVVRV